jgi:hypothetical protein
VLSTTKTCSSHELEASLSHTIGNVMNEIIFGMTYAADDAMWLKLQFLREKGKFMPAC